MRSCDNHESALRIFSAGVVVPASGDGHRPFFVSGSLGLTSGEFSFSVARLDSEEPKSFARRPSSRCSRRWSARAGSLLRCFSFADDRMRVVTGDETPGGRGRQADRWDSCRGSDPVHRNAPIFSTLSTRRWSAISERPIFSGGSSIRGPAGHLRRISDGVDLRLLVVTAGRLRQECAIAGISRF